MTEPIRITRAATLKTKPKDGDLGFGQIFTDHMFVADFQDEKGWYDPRIEPYGPLALDPVGRAQHLVDVLRRHAVGDQRHLEVPLGAVADRPLAREFLRIEEVGPAGRSGLGATDTLAKDTCSQTVSMALIPGVQAELA